MKILHQLGHNKKWNIDAFFENGIGDGLIHGAFNTKLEKLQNLEKKLLDYSLIDLQYYGKKSSHDLGKFDTYPFHPASSHVEGRTTTDGMTNIYNGIQFQENIGINKIIIPNYYESRDIDKFVEIIKKANEFIGRNKKDGLLYYMTIPLSNSFIHNDDVINLLLTLLTDMNIYFNGYYIVCEASPGYKQKVSVDFDYLENVSRFFSVLKKQGFSIIYGYANWDAIIFISLVDLDYVTIGTYENLRNFNNIRYSQKGAGGPSDGWYFSEKLLNFIRAREITNLRRNGCLNLVSNAMNIFSDVILEPGFAWNTHKPDVHKNYLLSISRFLQEISSLSDKAVKIEFMLEKIEAARNTYRGLAERRVFLTDESADYHLGTWLSFLRSKK